MQQRLQYPSRQRQLFKQGPQIFDPVVLYQGRGRRDRAAGKIGPIFPLLCLPGTAHSKNPPQSRRKAEALPGAGMEFSQQGLASEPGILELLLQPRVFGLIPHTMFPLGSLLR